MPLDANACRAAWWMLAEKTNAACRRPRGQTAWQHCFISSNASSLSVCPVYPTPYPLSLSIPPFLLAAACWLKKKWAWPQINPSAYLFDPSRGTSPHAATNTQIEILLTAADKPTCNMKASWCNHWPCWRNTEWNQQIKNISIESWSQKNKRSVSKLQHVVCALFIKLAHRSTISCQTLSVNLIHRWMGAQLKSLTLERGGARMYHLQSTASAAPALPSLVIWWDSTIPSGPTMSYWQAERHVYA